MERPIQKYKKASATFGERLCKAKTICEKAHIDPDTNAKKLILYVKNNQSSKMQKRNKISSKSRKSHILARSSALPNHIAIQLTTRPNKL